jgi:predicted deacylase
MSDALALCPRRAASCRACSTLLSHACTADMVLDLHCDAEAALHMYALPQHWPQWRSLAAHLNVKVGLLAEDSGGSSFDEACSLPWLRLSRVPEAQIPLACLATTLELGGQADTGRDEAIFHAEGILAFLAEQGLITASGRRRNTSRAKACPSKALNCCLHRMPAWSVTCVKPVTGWRPASRF